ncbi:hypothetical protein N7466_003375 [Penicillium verhagenii]|uniref:uncharacterized protein n=1 Tax=Penicillium verhagenii TaxID=1562060 RepID=UPI00254547CE|nr:uncharacterized protein N7466_003375 [Penicillium verhagenii]KAJ5936925.1 hypothetical protein N7466_003375 [Penicillium verhagenii]
MIQSLKPAEESRQRQESNSVQAVPEDERQSLVCPILRGDDHKRVIMWVDLLNLWRSSFKSTGLHQRYSSKVYLGVSYRNWKKLQVFQDNQFYEKWEQIYVLNRKHLHSLSVLKSVQGMSTDIRNVVCDVREEIE